MRFKSKFRFCAAWAIGREHRRLVREEGWNQDAATTWSEQQTTAINNYHFCWDLPGKQLWLDCMAPFTKGLVLKYEVKEITQQL